MTLQLDPQNLATIRERTLDLADTLPRHIGRYEIRGELGHGGMGIVYDAFDPELSRPVAVKVIHNERLRGAESEQLAERFEREMRATSDLFHPNLVAILDAGVEQGPIGPRAYYVMERIDGESLEQRLRRAGALGRREGLAIACAIARGLEAAHAHGLVHRDLKPANVLLPANSDPRIADFGLCLLRDGAETERDEEEGAPILGSAHYIAPEQVRAEAVGARADLFSLGAVLVRMFSGREPFLAETTNGHLLRILGDEPDGLERLDPDLRALASQLMAKRASDRPASAGEVAERLAAMAPEAERDPDATPTDAAAKRGPSDSAPGQGGTALWGIGLAVLAGLLASALLLRNELIALDTAADVQLRHVESQLQREHSLIPELAAIADRYAAHEGAVVDRVLDARRARVGAASAGEDPMSRVVVVAEQYPDLKSDRHFLALSAELAGTQNRIAIERMRYNEAAGALNRRLQQLPWRWVSRSLEPRPYLTAKLADAGAAAGRATTPSLAAESKDG